MSKTAVLFDFDGTLFFGTTEINYYAINMALGDMGRPPISMEIANTTVGDKSPDACRRILESDDPELVQTLLVSCLHRMGLWLQVDKESANE